VSDAKITIREVASKAKVSTAAVSLFLNSKTGLAANTRQRIAHAIDELGYVPRKSSKVERGKPTITVLIENLRLSVHSDIFYGEVIESIEAHASELGYHLLLKVVQNDSNVHTLLNQHSNEGSGLLLLGGGDLNPDLVRAVIDRNVPAVLVDNHLPNLPIDCVAPDYVTGAYQATRYLLELGCQRIACIRGPAKYRSLSERFYGYCCALLDSNGFFDPNLIDPSLIQADLSEGNPVKGYQEMKALLARGNKFDAVFCVSDRTGFGALEALKEARVQVPREVSVVGFDNVAQAAHVSPSLTTVDVNKHELGRLAMRRLHELIRGQAGYAPITQLVPTMLVRRNSTLVSD
jgi:DNA-binding LacI/PurR family transcriptional regulator